MYEVGRVVLLLWGVSSQVVEQVVEVLKFASARRTGRVLAGAHNAVVR